MSSLELQVLMPIPAFAYPAFIREKRKVHIGWDRDLLDSCIKERLSEQEHLS